MQSEGFLYTTELWAKDKIIFGEIYVDQNCEVKIFDNTGLKIISSLGRFGNLSKAKKALKKELSNLGVNFKEEVRPRFK